MHKGIYCLVFRNPGCTARIGARGPVVFRNGWHCYVGSALGSGGLSRLDRHIALAASRDKQPKWHVDYLLTDERFTLLYAVCALTTERFECDLARALGEPQVPSFGCSDCHCGSHLFFRPVNPAPEIARAIERLGLVPVTKTIMNRECSTGNL
jgi:Uri superfamily endonuclease